MDFTIMPYHLSCLPPLSAVSLTNYIIASFPDHLSLYSHNSHIADLPLPAVSVLKFPNTKQIICSSTSSTFIYNLEEFKEIRSFDSTATVKSISTHNSPAIFFTGDKSGSFRVWDIRQKNPTFVNKTHKLSIKSIDSKQNIIVAGGKEGSLKVADMRKMVFETVCCNENISDLSISSNSERVSVLHSNSIFRIYNLNSFETILTSACSKSYIVKDRPEGILILSSHKLALFNTRGLVLEKQAQWSYPLHLSASNKILTRDLGIDVWELLQIKSKSTGIDFDKLNQIDKVVNVRMTVESRALSERSVATIHSQVPAKFDEVLNMHGKTMTLLQKRLKITEELAELLEIGGPSKLFPRILNVELAVQASILTQLLSGKPRPTFIALCNAEAFLQISLRLGKSKNNYFAEIASKATGVILREISQDLCAVLATSLQTTQSDQKVCIKIFRVLEDLLKTLKTYKRGLIELNEIEFLIEKLKPRVEKIVLPEEEEGNFFIY